MWADYYFFINQQHYETVPIIFWPFELKISKPITLLLETFTPILQILTPFGLRVTSPYEINGRTDGLNW